MNRKIRWITESAVLLALLISLQAVGSMIPEALTKQLVTGTLVNCVLAVSVLLVGLSSGITIALISPVCAFMMGIAPNLITVLPIMAGNVCFVVLLKLLFGKSKILALGIAAIAKFGVLYLLVVQVVCGIASPALLGQKLGNTVLLAPPMLKMLPTMFSWPQLLTALTGGVIALLIFPTLKKALHK